MAKMIYKYKLNQEHTDIDMPIGAIILAAQSQRNDICLWALVDETAHKEKRFFVIYGTGHLLVDNPGRYIGTVQVHEGMLVWHVFEVNSI